MIGLDGDGAANLLAGMRGDDETAGGDGADTLWGGRRDDTLHGGPVLNRLTGGPGRDRFVLDETSSDAVITDFAGDRVDSTAFGFTRSELEQRVTIESARPADDPPEAAGSPLPATGQRARVAAGQAALDAGVRGARLPGVRSGAEHGVSDGTSRVLRESG